MTHLRTWATTRVSYNGYYASLPRTRRRFDSAHPLQNCVASASLRYSSGAIWRSRTEDSTPTIAQQKGSVSPAQVLVTNIASDKVLAEDQVLTRSNSLRTESRASGFSVQPEQILVAY